MGFITDLNHTVSAYLEIAERKAKRHEIMHMKDWVSELERFIEFQKMPVLEDAGSVSHEEAMEYAGFEYDKYTKKSSGELTQVEKDFLTTIQETYRLLENKKK